MFLLKDFELHHGFNVLRYIANFGILNITHVSVLPKSEIELNAKNVGWLNYIVIKLFVKFRILIIIMLLEDIYWDERVDVDVHEGDGKRGTRLIAEYGGETISIWLGLTKLIAGL